MTTIGRPMTRWLRAVAPRSLAAAGAAVAALAFSACNTDKLLDVQDVDVATQASLMNKAGLPVLYGGALSEFQVGLTGTDAAVTLPGLMTDELRDIDTFPTRIEVDQRNVQVTNGTVQTWYRQLHRARAALERAASAYAQFDSTNVNRAEMHAVDGFTYILFAEDFCNGVAYSTLTPDGKIIYGAPQTKDQSLKIAIAHFDTAIALARKAKSSNIANLAKIGTARALLDLGKSNLQAAADTVADVPVTYQYYVNNSTNSGPEQSGIYVNVGPLSKRFAVADKDGGNGLPFRTEGRDSSTKNNPTQSGDPRVRWYRLGVGQDGTSPAYYTLKYPDYSTGVVLADGVEAQLIIAENQLDKGGDWLGTLNALRSNSALLGRPPYQLSGQSASGTLPPLIDPGTTASRVDLLFHERAFWLYLTGHRLGDLRRLIVQYGRTGTATDPGAAVFPTGAYQGAAGGLVGADVNFPIPVDEQNNPSAPGCTDRNP